MAAKQGRTREALEGLSKDELVSRAEALGIDGARKFTRVELIDEISRAAGSGESERGLLGRARDLLREVVEKGLARPASVPPSAPKSTNGNGTHAATLEDPSPPVPTVTLAEIYFAQGHLTRARAILREVLSLDANDEQARALLERIERRELPTPAEVAKFESSHVASAPVPTAPAESQPVVPSAPADPYTRIGIEPEAFAEPAAERYPDVPPMLDDAAFPARYDVDECVAMAVDPTTVYVYWETRPKSGERARQALHRSGAGDAKSTLRVLVVEPTEGGPRVSSRDFDLIDLEYGEWFVRDLPAGSVVRAAVGLRDPNGAKFVPIAHTVDVEAPAASPSSAVATEVVVWSEGGTRSPSGGAPVLRPIARDTGTLGLPALPEPPEDELNGRGLSSAELARRARVERARAAGREIRPEQGRAAGASDLLAGPSSASWLGSR